jgi:exopolysaccharide biosynthesis polyprenyl glycosylphosphotransferase
MIKRYQNSAGAITRFIDAGIVGFAWLASYPIRFQWFQSIAFQGLPDYDRYFALLPLILILWTAGFHFLGVYRYERVLRRSAEIFTMLRAHLAIMVVFTSLTYFITEYRFSRGVMIIFGLQVLFGTWGFRVVFRKFLRIFYDRKKRASVVLAMGEGESFDHLLNQIQRFPELGLKVGANIGPSNYDDFKKQLMKIRPTSVLLALPQQEVSRLNAIIQSLKDEAIDIYIVPDYSQFLAIGATVDRFEGIPLVQLNESPLHGYQAWLKRMSDFALSLIGLLLLFPVLLLVTVLVKVTSKGPVLYRQERMGLDGRTFSMLKFRSMKVDAELDTGAVWAKKQDDRRTAIGAFLRSTSLDELPQLWNVLMGDMSLVGPRPERPVFVSKFRHEIPNYMLRHKVKTGITGWAQVQGWRGDTSLEKRIECDLYYIRNWSMWLDLKILFLTVFKGFVNKNAY